MKFEEKLKQKYLYSPGFNLLKLLYFYAQKLKGNRDFRKSFSGGAQDLIIDYFFKNIKKGVYIDVGCYHPYKGNNTKLLYDKGWSGINIDLDFHTIDFFNFVRKRDQNINVAISDKEEEKNLYFVHNRSAINSLSDIRKEKATEIKKIQTKTLNTIFENSKFKNEKINLISIDVEGHEIEVLKSLDLKRYSPQMIVIEYLDKKIIHKLEFYNQNIEEIINSEIYQYMIKNNYKLVNWLHSDLIFVHNSICDD